MHPRGVRGGVAESELRFADQLVSRGGGKGTNEVGMLSAETSASRDRLRETKVRSVRLDSQAVDHEGLEHRFRRRSFKGEQIDAVGEGGRFGSPLRRESAVLLEEVPDFLGDERRVADVGDLRIEQEPEAVVWLRRGAKEFAVVDCARRVSERGRREEIGRTWQRDDRYSEDGERFPVVKDVPLELGDVPSA